MGTLRAALSTNTDCLPKTTIDTVQGSNAERVLVEPRREFYAAIAHTHLHYPRHSPQMSLQQMSFALAKYCDLAQYLNELPIAVNHAPPAITPQIYNDIYLLLFGARPRICH